MQDTENAFKTKSPETLNNLVYIYTHTQTRTQASKVAQWWRTHLPMRETLVQSLGQEDSLGKEMETHSSILARGSLMGKRAWQAIVHGVTRVGQDLETKATIYTYI